jgi:hypothetical protein
MSIKGFDRAHFQAKRPTLNAYLQYINDLLINADASSEGAVSVLLKQWPAIEASRRITLHCTFFAFLDFCGMMIYRTFCTY